MKKKDTKIQAGNNSVHTGDKDSSVMVITPENLGQEIKKVLIEFFTEIKLMEKFEQINTRFEQIDLKFKQIDEQFGQVNNNIAAIAEHNTHIIQESIEEVIVRIEQLESRIVFA